MALPGEQDSAYPDAYLTKVPSAVRRRETRWSETSADTPLPARPSFVMREDDVLYFDYGAVRLGRKPQQPDAPGGEDAARLVCVGLGWLPAWAFTINPRGLADIKPSGDDDKKDDRRGPGVLGLLYKLVSDDDDGPRRPLLSISKTPAVRAEDLSSATPKAWAEAVPFHPNLKVLRPVQVYMHVFDGGVGHKYDQKKGQGTVVVPFRTPAWSVHAVVHVDPPRRPAIRGELRESSGGRLQGEWVAKELNRWIKETKLPPAYVDERLREWVPCDPTKEGIVYKKKKEGRGGWRKFIGFS